MAPSRKKHSMKTGKARLYMSSTCKTRKPGRPVFVFGQAFVSRGTRADQTKYVMWWWVAIPKRQGDDPTGRRSSVAHGVPNPRPLKKPISPFRWHSVGQHVLSTLWPDGNPGWHAGQRTRTHEGRKSCYLRGLTIHDVTEDELLSQDTISLALN